MSKTSIKKESVNKIKIDEKISLKDLSMMDDRWFSAVLDKNNELATFILRIILDKKDIKVTKINTQVRISNPTGRSIVLDAIAIDSNKRVYNIEMQQAKRKDIFYRARCHLSLLDNRNMDKGYKFSDLPETYIIFFCDFDIKSEGKPIYFGGSSFYDGERIDDGTHSVYVNCKYEGRSNDIGKLIHDMKSKVGEKKCYNIFSKQDRKGDYQMSDFWERIRKKIRKEVYKEARKEVYEEVEERVKESIITMLKNGLDISLISDISKKSTSEILAIKSDNCL